MGGDGAGGGVEDDVDGGFAVGERVGGETVDDAELGHLFIVFEIDVAAVGDAHKGCAGDAVGKAVFGEGEFFSFFIRYRQDRSATPSPSSSVLGA